MLGIYTRISIEDDESNSTTNQFEEGKQYANNNNIKKYELYAEKEGLKGDTPINQRPALLKLVNDIQSKKITRVFVRKQSRITRSMKILQEFFDIIIKEDVILYMGGMGELDMKLPNTQLLVNIMGSFDAFLPATQSYETKKALHIRAEKGFTNITPYGYSKNDLGETIIHKKEAEIVKRIFKESLSGKGVYTITVGLDKNNIPTKTVSKLNEENSTFKETRKQYVNGKLIESNRKNGKWQRATVYTILKNKWYIGKRKYGGIDYDDVPKIIDLDTFNKVQNNLKTNKKNSGKSVEGRYLLKGLLICGVCGRSINGRKVYNKNRLKKSKYNANYYGCSSKRTIHLSCISKSISIPQLETFIIKILFKNNNLINKLKNIDINDDVLNNLKKELDNLLKQKNDKEKESNNIRRVLISDSTLSDRSLSEFTKQLNNIDLFLDILDTKINNLQIKITEKSNNLYINNHIKVKEYYNTKWTFKQYKESINLLIEDITINQNYYKNNKGKKKLIYTLKIKYKGFDYTNEYKTGKPFKTWLWSNQTYKEPTKKIMYQYIKLKIDLLKELIVDDNYNDDLKKQLKEDLKVYINYKDLNEDKLKELYNTLKIDKNINLELQNENDTKILLGDNELFDFD